MLQLRNGLKTKANKFGILDISFGTDRKVKETISAKTKTQESHSKHCATKVGKETAPTESTKLP
jgi:hypothetical protein